MGGWVKGLWLVDLWCEMTDEGGMCKFVHLGLEVCNNYGGGE